MWTSVSCLRKILINKKKAISCYLLIEVGCALTVSNKDDATAASVTPPALMLARTGAPNPIEESWRLEWKKNFFFLKKKRKLHN